MIDLKGYLLRFSVFAAVLYLGSIIFSFVADKRVVSDAILFIVPFFYLSGVLSRYIIYQASKKNNKKVPLTYLSTSTGRLFFYIFILVGYGFVFRHDAYPFMITFFCFYVLFTSFEIASLYKSLHSSKK